MGKKDLWNAIKNYQYILLYAPKVHLTDCKYGMYLLILVDV